MWLDLKDVIEIPGASVSFQTVLDPDPLLTPSVRGFQTPPAAEGQVVNTAGLLRLEGTLRAEMRCVCDRCAAPFVREKVLAVEMPLAASEENAGEDEFPLDGDGVDVNEALQTCFLLDMESKLLCRADCRGLCPSCGKNLNDGPCGCVKPKDPRFAALARLLENPTIEN